MPSHSNQSHSHAHGDEETGCCHHHEAKEHESCCSHGHDGHHSHNESVDNHKIALDGRVGKSNEGVADHPTRRRSSFYVKGLCCKSEVPQVTSILRGSSTEVHNVSINVTARMVYVDHCTDILVPLSWLMRSIQKDSEQRLPKMEQFLIHQIISLMN